MVSMKRPGRFDEEKTFFLMNGVEQQYPHANQCVGHCLILYTKYKSKLDQILKVSAKAQKHFEKIHREAV